MLEMVLGLLVLTLAITIFGTTIFLIISLFTDFDFMTLFLTIFMIIICLIPVGMVYDSYQKDNAQQQVIENDVVVISKVYHPPSTRLVLTGKTTTIVPVSAKHLLTIASIEHTQTIDDKNIYEAFEIGDKFKMNLVQYVNENGKVFAKEFKFIQ